MVSQSKLEITRKLFYWLTISNFLYIIVLIILAGVTLNILLGENGIINRTKTAKEENEKATATETMNLKITNVQISTYVEKQRMPTLKELADNFCDDGDFEKVIEKTEVGAVGNLPKISNENPTAIIAKLYAYPYEFEINSSLQLASIDGVKVASIPENDGDSIVSMTMSELQSTINSAIDNKLKDYSTTTDISSTYATKEEINNNNNVLSAQLSNISSGITLTRNIIRKSGNTVYIDIRGYYSSNIPTGNDFNIGTIPTGYTPHEDLISNVNLSNNEWNVNAVGYLYISGNGSILIRNFNSTNYKYFSICESYVVE